MLMMVMLVMMIFMVVVMMLMRMTMAMASAVAVFVFDFFVMMMFDIFHNAFFPVNTPHRLLRCFSGAKVRNTCRNRVANTVFSPHLQPGCSSLVEEKDYFPTFSRQVNRKPTLMGMDTSLELS